MMNKKYYRHYIKNLIKMNFSDVEVERVEVSYDKYKNKIEKITDLGKKKIYICRKNDRIYRDILHDHGSINSSNKSSNLDTRFLAEWDEDLEEGDILNGIWKVDFIFDCNGIAKMGGLIEYDGKE